MSKPASTPNAPAIATSAVLVQSEEMPENTPAVKGYDFNQGLNYDALFSAFATTGFQGSNFHRAIEEVNKMLRWRLSDDPIKPDDAEENKDPEYRKSQKCTIFLGFTSNMVSCGVREVIRFLVQHKMVDCLVTTGGAVEEDIMKCMNPHFMGDFKLSGKMLRKKGINRIGNLLVPNNNYCSLEDWIMPVLDEMHKEQVEKKTIWSPSKMIKRFGERIDNPDSIWYWAAKNDIPVFCPAITDGSVGDMIYFHSYKFDDGQGLILDLVQDIRGINSIATFAHKTGMLILGGGVVKHHICNANLMRNGADFSVFINTAAEYDGSDAGASPDEAISWGKIKIDSDPVKVWGDASLVFPLLVSQTFAKHHQALVSQQK